MDMGDFSFDQLGEGEAFISDYWFHGLFVDVHGDEDFIGAVGEKELCKFPEDVGAFFDIVRVLVIFYAGIAFSEGRLE